MQTRSTANWPCSNRPYQACDARRQVVSGYTGFNTTQITGRSTEKDSWFAKGVWRSPFNSASLPYTLRGDGTGEAYDMPQKLSADIDRILSD